MLEILIIDCLHGFFWCAHFGVLLLTSILLSLTTFLLTPTAMTLSFGVHWRWAVFVPALLMSALMGLFSFRKLVRSQEWAHWRRAYRDRKNGLSLIRKGPVLGSPDGVGPYVAVQVREWRRQIRLSARGFFGMRALWIYIACGVAAAFTLQQPLTTLVTLLRGYDFSRRLDVVSAKLELPSYTGQDPMLWSGYPGRTLRAEFIHGSFFSFTIKDGAKGADSVRFALLPDALTPSLARLQLLDTESTSSASGAEAYVGKLQLVESARLVPEVMLWGRVWERGAALFQFVRLRDELPKLRIQWLGHEKRILEGEKIPFKVEVDDDFGVQKIMIRLTQKTESGENRVDELVKYFSKPVPESDEIFIWDSGGASLLTGAFSVEFVATDAAVEPRDQSEAHSTAFHFDFISEQKQFEDLQALLLQWLQLTNEHIAEVDRALSENKGSVGHDPYFRDGQHIAVRVEPLQSDSRIVTVLNQWGRLKAIVPTLNQTDVAAQNIALTELMQFKNVLENVLRERQDEHREEEAGKVREAFEAMKDVYLNPSQTHEQRKAMRKQFQEKLATWMKSFPNLDDEMLNKWTENNSVASELENMKNRGEKATPQQLDQMAQELEKGMSLWEQASQKHEEKQMNQLRQKLQEAADLIKETLERQNAIREGTRQHALDTNAGEQAEKDLARAQQRLAENMDEMQEAFREEFSSVPQIQAALKKIFSKSQEQMKDAAAKLDAHNPRDALLAQENAMRELMQGAQNMERMMREGARKPSYQKGQSQKDSKYFRRSLNGPFEGPREYRDALRKTIKKDDEGVWDERMRKSLYQQLMR